MDERTGSGVGGGVGHFRLSDIGPPLMERSIERGWGEASVIFGFCLVRLGFGKHLLAGGVLRLVGAVGFC